MADGQNQTTCYKLTIDKFPNDILSIKALRHGGLALYICIALYLFVAMALVIQAYLVSAIHIFADYLHIASYSGRNTIVIPGTLLPEFFIALISVFVEKGNICSATIIGSCAANSLLTLGAVGLILSKPVKLSWYPLWRDNIFYSVAVTILLWTTYDHKMKWQECMFLSIVYLVYLLIINFNHAVERGVRRIVHQYRTGDDEVEADIQIEKLSLIESRRTFAYSAEERRDAERSINNKPGSVASSHANDMVVTYCGCGDRTSKGGLYHNVGIPEERSGELSGDADDPTIDIEEPDECICEENVDYHNEESSDHVPSPFSQVDATSLYSQGSISCPSDREQYLSNEHVNLHSNSSHRYESTGGYGSCGNESVGSKDIYKWEDSLTSKTTITRFARYSQRVFHPQNYMPGSYYLTIDMNHYINGPSSPFSIPRKWYMKIFWVMSLPAILAFHVTIPDCRKPKWKTWYPVTMLTSALWVAFLTYIVLWMAVEIGYVWKIPDAVMGFVFLATGLSFSKIVTTYFQSKAGYGFKAVYSIYGSNVFNLTINLGFVWFIVSVVENPYILHSGSIVYINLCQLIIVLTPLLLQFTRWRLNKCLALIYLILYACFTAIVVLMEYDIIGSFNQNIC